MRALLRYRGDRRALRAFDERLELVKAGVTRRDLMKMGLMTGGGVGGGMLLSDKSLAAGGRGPGALGALPPLAPFVQPLPVLPTLPERDVGRVERRPRRSLRTGRRTRQPACRSRAAPSPISPRSASRSQSYRQTLHGREPRAQVHPGLPAQTVWGFNLGGADLSADPPTSPGPVLTLRHLESTLVRRHNALPPPGQNGGFGVPEVSTHLHNFHSAPDSDGGPCDPVQQRFFFRGQYYDYFHNMRFAGWNSTNPPDGEHPGGARLPVVPRPPRRPHGGEHLQGPRRSGDHLQRIRHRRRVDRAPPAELPELRHPARVRRQALRPAHRPARLRHVQHRRPPRQRVPRQRQGAAVLRGVQAPLPLPASRRRARRASTSSSSRTRTTRPKHPVPGDLRRRQPAAAADRGHERPRRRGRAQRHHHRLRKIAQRFGNADAASASRTASSRSTAAGRPARSCRPARAISCSSSG